MFPSILKQLAGISLAGLLAAASAQAATLEITVGDASGAPLEQAVATLEPTGKAAPPANVSAHAVMDQRSLVFSPQLLVIRAGTVVDFPNSDNVRHQVYSFSPAKRFELKLYSGKHQSSVQFDQPGVVTLGCNIHDWMLGYIDVVATPWFARSDKRGRIVMNNVQPGQYTLKLWHPRLSPGASAPVETVTLADAPVRKAFTLDVRAAESANQVPAGLETGLGARVHRHAD